MQTQWKHQARFRAARTAVAASGISALGITAAMAQQPGPYYGPHMWDGGGWMLFGPLTMIVTIGAVIVLAVLLVQWLGGGMRASGASAGSETAREILRSRFARGEIDQKEFEERRRVLDA